MIGMIAAVTSNGVIGVDDKLPFDYPEDMKHFRTTTAGSVVIMGRKTFQGIGRPLPKRRNIVISKIAKGLGVLKTDGIETAGSLKDALAMCTTELPNSGPAGEPPRIWLIGGSSIYEAGMEYADVILLTLTPDVELAHNAIRFPWINPGMFNLQSVKPLVPENPDCKLQLATYTKYNKII